MIPRLVITGAPGSGKTDFLNRLRTEPAFAGFVFFAELARQLLVEQPGYRQQWGEFHREIYRRQCEREDTLADKPFITDRGTVDAFAFHPETAANVGTSIVREYQRYTAVVQLGSAAQLGEPYYACDDIRRESIADALFIERAIEQAWRGHRGYHFIEATVDYDEKYRRFLRLMQQLAEPVSLIDKHE